MKHEIEGKKQEGTLVWRVNIDSDDDLSLDVRDNDSVDWTTVLFVNKDGKFQKCERVPERLGFELTDKKEVVIHSED